MDRIQRWDMYELELVSPKKYGNPFMDGDLRACNVITELFGSFGLVRVDRVVPVSVE